MCPLGKAQGLANPGSVYCSPLLTKNRDFLQEGFVQLSLSDGAAHEDATVGVSVNCPQFHVCLSLV